MNSKNEDFMETLRTVSNELINLIDKVYEQNKTLEFENDKLIGENKYLRDIIKAMSKIAGET